MNITLRFNHAKYLLFALWALVVGGGFASVFGEWVLHEDGEWVSFFGLSYEQNLPTWFVSSLLLMCALLLAGIAAVTRRSHSRFFWYWAGLAAAFLYISLDETATIHEHASDWFDFDGFLYFGWVIPAGILVGVMGLCYLRFLAHLPRKTCLRFMIAGTIYVGGALGVELALGHWTDNAGRHNLMYNLLDLGEESMELLGVTLFLLALLEYIGLTWGDLRVRITREYRSGRLRSTSLELTAEVLSTPSAIEPEAEAAEEVAALSAVVGSHLTN